MGHIMISLTLAASIRGILTVDSQDVYFINAGSVGYTVSDHSISPGEAWVGAAGCGNSAAGCGNKITVWADRHNTAGPAEFFNKGLGPVNVIAASASQQPNTLNFAMSGTLTMNVGGDMVTCSDLRIGQGFNGPFDGNNWWIGGLNCRGGDNPTDALTCECEDAAKITFSSPGSTAFYVKLGDPCDVFSTRFGSWVPLTAAAGEEVNFEFSSSSTQYTEEDFMSDLTTSIAAPIQFGNLEMTAQQSYQYVNHLTVSSGWKMSCSFTVPDGKRAWQWSFGIDTDQSNTCPGGMNTMGSCYFIFLNASSPGPCCLAGYQDPANYKKCTEPGKNMCDGNKERLNSLRR
jgi:hypothetical protein